MLDDFLLMLVIMNPFAQTLFLSPLMSKIDGRQFVRVLGEGAGFTFLICMLCAVVGEFILFRMFQVTLPAMRVFGGLINLHLAWAYVLKGPSGVKLFRGDVAELAQQIAMPVMVGAGVVWVSIRIGRMHDMVSTTVIIAAAIAVNCLLIEAYRLLLTRSRGRWERIIPKYFGMAMRFNALLAGAVSVQMILGGVLEFIGGGVPQAAPILDTRLVTG